MTQARWTNESCGYDVALKITKPNVDGVAVVSLDGRVVLGEESGELRNTVKSDTGS